MGPNGLRWVRDGFDRYGVRWTDMEVCLLPPWLLRLLLSSHCSLNNRTSKYSTTSDFSIFCDTAFYAIKSSKAFFGRQKRIVKKYFGFYCVFLFST